MSYKRKWTIATVNFMSTDYIRWQAKMLHEFNDDFVFIILDNSYPKLQVDELEEIKKEYTNTVVIYNAPPNSLETVKGGSGSHGKGLTHILNNSKSKYFLANDPDFFWVIKGHLRYLEKYFDQGFHAVGAQNLGALTFPNIWGSAYITEEIRGCNLQAKSSFCSHCNQYVYDTRYDTGWELFIRLKHLPYKYFRETEPTVPFLGPHSYDFKPMTYADGDTPVGHHLMRGAYYDNDFLTPKMQIARNNYGKYFYDLMNSQQK